MHIKSVITSFLTNFRFLTCYIAFSIILYRNLDIIILIQGDEKLGKVEINERKY